MKNIIKMNLETADLFNDLINYKEYFAFNKLFSIATYHIINDINNT